MNEQAIVVWLVIGIVTGASFSLLTQRRGPRIGGVVAVILGIAGTLLAGGLASAAGLVSGEWQLNALASLGAIAILTAYRQVLVRRR